MRPDSIVLSAPVLDENLCLFEGVEDLNIEQTISEFAVETFTVSVLPRTAGFDEQRGGSKPAQPLTHCPGCELWSVVYTSKESQLDENPIE